MNYAARRRASSLVNHVLSWFQLTKKAAHHFLRFVGHAGLRLVASLIDVTQQIDLVLAATRYERAVHIGGHSMREVYGQSLMVRTSFTLVMLAIGA